VRLVLSQHHRPAGQPGQPGHDLGHGVSWSGSPRAVSFGRRQIATSRGYDRSASYWTGPGRSWLAELDLPAASREIITDCLAVIDGLAPLIERIDGELHACAKTDPRVKVLRTLPGVGEFTALVMLAEIGDISRFGSARKLAAWAGLTPTVRGSDLKVRHGHISKQGSAWLRWAMNQAAQTAKRSPEFAASYAAISKRRPGGRKGERPPESVAALGEAAARACPLQPGQLPGGEDRDQLGGHLRRLQPGHRVGQLVFGGQPFEELLQGAVLVAGVRGTVAVQQPCHPLLDLAAGDLLPATPAGPPGQARGGEPVHCLGVGPDCLGGLALGGPAQGE